MFVKTGYVSNEEGVQGESKATARSFIHLRVGQHYQVLWSRLGRALSGPVLRSLQGHRCKNSRAMVETWLNSIWCCTGYAGENACTWVLRPLLGAVSRTIPLRAGRMPPQIHSAIWKASSQHPQVHIALLLELLLTGATCCFPLHRPPSFATGASCKNPRTVLKTAKFTRSPCFNRLQHLCFKSRPSRWEPTHVNSPQ